MGDQVEIMLMFERSENILTILNEQLSSILPKETENLRSDLEDSAIKYWLSVTGDKFFSNNFKIDVNFCKKVNKPFYGLSSIARKTIHTINNS